MKTPESWRGTDVFAAQLLGVMEDDLLEPVQQLEAALVVLLQQLEDALDIIALDLSTLRAEGVVLGDVDDVFPAEQKLLLAGGHFDEVKVLFDLQRVDALEHELLQVVKEVLQLLLPFAVDCFHGLEEVYFGGEVLVLEMVLDLQELEQLVELAEAFGHVVRKASGLDDDLIDRHHVFALVSRTYDFYESAGGDSDILDRPDAVVVHQRARRRHIGLVEIVRVALVEALFFLGLVSKVHQCSHAASTFA